MTVTLELTEEQARVVESARDKGIDVDMSLRAALTARIEAFANKNIDSENVAAMSLLANLNKAGATDDLQERQNAEEELRELMDNLNAQRYETYPRVGMTK